jgi:hypothetical protein
MREHIREAKLNERYAFVIYPSINLRINLWLDDSKESIQIT